VCVAQFELHLWIYLTQLKFHLKRPCRVCRIFVASLITRRPVFDPRWVHPGFVVATVAMGVVFHRILRFPSVNIIAPVPVTHLHILCDFDRASSLICGNKMPARCNRGFYCRSYCLLGMFRAPLCPSSGAQEYYTVVAAYGISCCGFQVAGLVWGW